MSCQTDVLNKAYADRILNLAKQIESGQRFDSATRLCRKDYLEAKRYKNILNYLGNDLCCPSNVKDEIIKKLLLNSKI